MTAKNHIISISGNARTGKDTLADNFVAILTSAGIKAKKLSFAYELKKSTDKFLQDQLGISAFTEDPQEKAIIRPFLVTWGTEVMRARNPEHWIALLSKSLVPDTVNIVADLRFMNELEWVQSEGGKSVFIERSEIPPANITELKNNEILKKNVDVFFNLCYLEDSNAQRCIAAEILNNLTSEEMFSTWKETCSLSTK
jgi:hypothetical protein